MTIQEIYEKYKNSTFDTSPIWDWSTKLDTENMEIAIEMWQAIKQEVEVKE